MYLSVVSKKMKKHNNFALILIEKESILKMVASLNLKILKCIHCLNKHLINELYETLWQFKMIYTL